jgi:A/G-specific adenine glycosylase
MPQARASTRAPRRLSAPGSRVAGNIRRALLRWFKLYARPLPWRLTRSPYTVWVSEVMLQQTQVETVIPYYTRFLRAFPTLAQLAGAPEERVLELWSGLGYYRRARHLHRAAQKVVREFGGEFPADYRQARSLPGVGDYTARALLSLAYHQPYAVVDGNVARVIARVAAVRGSIVQPAFRRRIERRLDQLLSRQQPGQFNEALMELGQTVCLPRAPRCAACPLGTWCQAYRQGDPERYPAPRPRRKTELRHLAAAVIQASAPRGPGQVAPSRVAPGLVAMIRGLDEGLLPDLWNFPAAFGGSPADALARLEAKIEQLAPGAVRWQRDRSRGAAPIPLLKLRHGITYRSIHVQVYAAEAIDGRSTHSIGTLRWFPAAGLDGAAVSQLARKIAGAAGLVDRREVGTRGDVRV